MTGTDVASCFALRSLGWTASVTLVCEKRSQNSPTGMSIQLPFIYEDLDSYQSLPLRNQMQYEYFQQLCPSVPQAALSGERISTHNRLMST